MNRGIWLFLVMSGASAAACGSDSGDSEKTGSGGTAGSSSSGGSASGGTGNNSGAGGAGGTSGTGGGAGGSGGTDGGGGSTPAGGSGGGTADAANDVATTDAGPAAKCFQGQFVNPPTVSLDYDQFAPTVGTHCKGTNHQDIKGVQRVVFLGDSVTVGTPPSNLNPAAVYVRSCRRRSRRTSTSQRPGSAGARPIPSTASRCPRSPVHSSAAPNGARAPTT